MENSLFFFPLAEAHRGVNHPEAKIQLVFENTVCSITLFLMGFYHGIQKTGLVDGRLPQGLAQP
jgi:hypothetical protein